MSKSSLRRRGHFVIYVAIDPDVPHSSRPDHRHRHERGARHALESLKVAAKETWIDERGLALYFNQARKTEQLARENDPRYIGLWNGRAKPRTLTEFNRG